MKFIDLERFKRKLVALALACIVVGMSACDGITRSPEEYVESAQVYLDQNDFPAAIVELKNALQVNAKYIEARILLADAYLKTGKGEDAEKEVRRAISLGMSPASGAVTLAEALLLQGDLQQVLDSPIELDATPKADQAKLLALRGIAHFGLGDLTSAENWYDKALSYDEHSKVALTGKAGMRASRGNLDGAKSLAKEVVANNPTYAPAWEFLGDIALAQENLDEAEAMYTAAIKQSHYLSESSLKRAGVRLQKEDYVALKEDTDTLIKAGYQSPHLFYFKGRVDFFNEAYSDAEQAFKNTLELNSKFWPAKVYLASTHLFLGQQQQALDLSQQLQSDAPDQNYLKGLLGATYANIGQFNQAKKALNDLLLTNPHNVYALSLLSQILLNEGLAEQAAVYLTRALSITPESKDLLYNLKIAKMMTGETLDYSSGDYGDVFMEALAELQKGNYKKALDIANQLHKEEPLLVDPLNLSAAAMLGARDVSGAKKAFEQALALEANNPTAAKNLATIEWQMGNADKAEKILSEFLIENPQDQNAVLKQATIKLQLKKPDESIALLKESLEKSPENVLIRTTLAQYYYDAGRYTEVLEVTNNIAGPLFEVQPVLWALRGKVNLLRNEKALARENFKKYTTLLPGSAHAHFLYADALSRSGKKTEARKELERTVEVDATYLPGRIGQVKMLVQHKELDQAKIAMAKLKEDFGEIPAVLGLEGWLALGQGDWVNAETSLSAAIAQDPSSEISLLLFRSLWPQGKYDQAYEVLNSRLEQRPKELSILEELAAAKLAQGKESDALEVYRRVVDDHPNHVLALNNLAWLSREQNLGQAITYAERALELAPRAAGVADTLAMLLLKKDLNSNRAFDLLQKAAKLAPVSSEIQLHFGTLLIERGQFAQAKNLLNSIAEDSSASSAITDQAAELLKSIPSSQ